MNYHDVQYFHGMMVEIDPNEKEGECHGEQVVYMHIEYILRGEKSG